MSDATPCKRGRPRKIISLDDRYPVVTANETVSTEDDIAANDALIKELQNAKPRKEIYLPLMKRTFPFRRHFILHNASSVRLILRDYPALKESSAVSASLGVGM